MGRKLRLELIDGCHEDWASMPDASGGKSCARCARDVIDLAGKTARQAAALLAAEEARTGGACARFVADAVTGEAIFAPDRSAPRSRTLLHGVMLAASLAAGCESVTYAATPPAPLAVLAPLPVAPLAPTKPPATTLVPVAPLPPPPPAPGHPSLAAGPDAGTADAGPPVRHLMGRIAIHR